MSFQHVLLYFIYYRLNELKEFMAQFMEICYYFSFLVFDVIYTVELNFSTQFVILRLILIFFTYIYRVRWAGAAILRIMIPRRRSISILVTRTSLCSKILFCCISTRSPFCYKEFINNFDYWVRTQELLIKKSFFFQMLLTKHGRFSKMSPFKSGE